MADDRLAALTAAGVSIWLDDLSRGRLVSGDLRRLIDDKHVVGVTTNPPTFAAALVHGGVYTPQIRELARRGATVGESVRKLMVVDGPRWERLAANGARVQRPLWASTGVKTPAYPDTRYHRAGGARNCEHDAGGNVERLRCSLRSADNGDTVAGRASEARELIDATAATGVSLAEVFRVLERDGVDRFTRSWAELHETVRRSMEAAAE